MWVLKLLDAEAGGEYIFGPFLTVEGACELADLASDSLVYLGGVVLEIHSPDEIVGLAGHAKKQREQSNEGRGA